MSQLSPNRSQKRALFRTPRFLGLFLKNRKSCAPRIHFGLPLWRRKTRNRPFGRVFFRQETLFLTFYVYYKVKRPDSSRFRKRGLFLVFQHFSRHFLGPGRVLVRVWLKSSEIWTQGSEPWSSLRRFCPSRRSPTSDSIIRRELATHLPISADALLRVLWLTDGSQND